MTANDSKFCLGYFNKLVDECNNTYGNPISKKPINADHSSLTGEIETNPKAPNY